MDIRKKPGRPGRDEAPAPSQKRTLMVPVEMDVAYAAWAKERGETAHALMKEALAEHLKRNGRA